MTASDDMVANDDPLHGDVLAGAALGAFVIDTDSGIRKKVRHVGHSMRLGRRLEPPA
jgi:hypothetical protein